MSIDQIPFGAHLGELRRRLVYCVATLALVFFACYAISDYIVRILFYPIRQAMPPGATMVFTSLTEGFMTYLKVSFWSAVVISAPVVLYQIWAFVAPALYDKEKRHAKTFMVWALTLFAAGAFFGYWVIMPAVLSITLGFASQGLEAMPRLQNYLLFALKTMFIFGIIFEIPFFMAFASRLGLVPADYFKRHRKVCYIALYVLAVMLVPTDFFSQAMLFAPLVCIFEIGIRLSGWLRV
ncbi:MAG: twin-arginine translocase subunit TatC [Desulfobacteraceae bacterium]|nr:twin-arginine translocase subunit TatC [Desulfobacteraceae bacterium]